jgi:GTP-binding protein HflX
VEAFRSTLEEVGQADLVVHVVDGAHPDPGEQVRAVREVLADIDVDADGVPELLVVNKADAADEETLLRLKRMWPEAVFVSARSGAGLDDLRRAIEARLPWPAIEVRACVPYARGDVLTRVHEQGEVLSTAHTGEGTLVHARVDEALAAALAPYAVDDDHDRE